MADSGGGGPSDYAVMAETRNEARQEEGGGQQGFASLGAALGGGGLTTGGPGSSGTEAGQMAYARGQQIGAQTLNAMAQAKQRIQEAVASHAAADFTRQHPEAIGADDSNKEYIALGIESGKLNPADVYKMADERQQEIARTTLRTNPNLSPQQAAAQSLAPGAAVTHAEGPLGSQITPTQGEIGANNQPLPGPGGGGINPMHVSPLQQSVTEAGVGLKQVQTANAKANGANTGLTDEAAFNAAHRYNITGTMPPLGMGGGSTRAKILEYAAHLSADPNWHPPSFDQESAPGAAPHPTAQNAVAQVGNAATTKANTSMLVDQTKRAATADASEQTASQNLDLAYSLIKKAGQTDSPAANWLQNVVRTQAFGDKDVAAYRLAINTAATEYARVISMATGATGITDEARREGQRLFNDTLSPSQLQNNIVVAKQEMNNRTGSLHDKIAQARRGLYSSPQAPGAGAPATYGSEAEALAAGHKVGDRVTIGGVSGTLQ